MSFTVGSQAADFALKDRGYFWWSDEPVRGKTKSPSWFDCPINFKMIKENFGYLFRVWMKKREEFGPGFYLYPGTRRATQLYAEHHFASLIWGIESFHRTKYGDPSPSDRLEKKIQRILEQVTNPSDRRWLGSKLEYSRRPTLSYRISKTIESLPIEIEGGKLKDFCDRCAEIRNDLSHGGDGARDGRQSSLEEIASISGALGYLYHGLILLELGLDREIIRAWFTDSFGSHARKEALIKAKLLTDNSEEELKLLLEKAKAMKEDAFKTQSPGCESPLPETPHGHEQFGTHSPPTPASPE